MLLDKYQDVESLAGQLGVRDFASRKPAARCRSPARPPTRSSATCCGTRSRSMPAGKARSPPTSRPIAATSTASTPCKPGESLSKIAKIHLDDANRYMDIFNANKDKLKDPNMIQPGQQLVIPNR